MKKTLIVVALVVIFSLAMAGVALASGYLTPTLGTYDSPHSGYAANTTKCKVCHAVHEPTGTYLLTRSNNNDVVCNVCHRGTSALSDEVVYGRTDAGAPVGASHRVGEPVAGGGAATSIPDSDGITLGVTYWGNADVDLNCKSCHSPHGSKLIGDGEHAPVILRGDPAYNTGEAYSVSEFCTDCHNKNTKSGSSGGVPGSINDDHSGKTHIMTTALTMSVSNFGTTVQVAFGGGSATCKNCHIGGKMTMEGAIDSAYTDYVWPHESPGLKLLDDDYDGTTTKLDKVCLRCHQSGGLGTGLSY